MRFLVLTTPKHPTPPTPALFDAMTEWVDAHTSSGKLEQTFAFAGRPGGGGLLNVESHEELDEIMTGFPFAPFSEITIYPITNLAGALTRGRDMFERMSEMMPQPGR